MRRCWFGLLVSTLIAAKPAAAEDLPAGMLGTWAPEAVDCADRPGEVIDSRMLVGPLTVERFAAIFTAREWRREGDAFRATAEVAEEGEDQPGEEPVRLELRLEPDGRLVLRVDEDEPQAYVRCPDGVPVR